MSIFTTIDLTRVEAINIIEDRMQNLSSLSDRRLEEILEAFVQDREYDEQTDEYDCNNFQIKK